MVASIEDQRAGSMSVIEQHVAAADVAVPPTVKP